MLIRAGLLIDGAGNPSRKEQYLAIENGRIAAVGQQADFAADQIAQAVDYSSCSVLPGLIDTHVHLFLEGVSDLKIREQRWKEAKEMRWLRAEENLEATLKKGVTTVRDLGGPDGIGIALREAVSQKKLAGPRVLTCHRAISVTGGHFHYAGGREADGPAAMAEAVREQVGAGADCIKLMLTGIVDFRTETAGAVEMSGRELQAAVEAAHRLNRPVSVHANGSDGVRLAIAAGVQTIEHGALLDEATADLVGGGPAYWTPTLTPFLRMFDYGREHVCRTLPEAGLQRVYTRHCAMVRRGIAAGAGIVAGTDAGALGVHHGEVWQELALFVELGMPPLQAIASATGEAAAAIGVGTETGVLTPGKQADLLVVQGNPLKDIKSLRNIVQVYKAGIKVLAPV
ncbi:MAG: amidohydrolase family protein [Negativicutes bacterium]|nr:amidohydrolase family protein [Negativicutes bacterium]